MMTMKTGGVVKASVPGGEVAGEAPLHPFYFPHIVERICHHLPLEDLKLVRLVNRTWWRASRFAWALKSKLKFEDVHRLRDFLTKIAQTRVVLPHSVRNWTFEGETVTKLMNDEGIAEQQLMIPFWPTVENLTFSNWRKTRFQYRQVHPDPQRPQYAEYVRTPYYVPSRIGSSYSAMGMMKLCTNLKQLVVHYPLLIKMKGAYIGPLQSPQLEKLSRLKVYADGMKWNPNLMPAANQSFDELFRTNLRRSDGDIIAFDLPRDVSGGNTFILRILDHSPNLKRIEVTTGTVMTTKVEQWFLRHLMHWRVKLPKLEDYHCSIPLHEYICQAFQTKTWPLRSLHLRTVLGEGNAINATALHAMISHFRDSLQHLELILYGTGTSTSEFHSGAELVLLESVEIWGFNGDLDFLTNMPKLKKAVIGALTPEGYQQLLTHFEANPLPESIQLEVKTPEDFVLRLDQGPQQGPFLT